MQQKNEKCEQYKQLQRYAYCLLVTILVFTVPFSTFALSANLSNGEENRMHLEAYDQLYFAILNITEGPGYDLQFDSLPEAAQALYVIAIFDAEIQNGGLCQFFHNCGSAYATRVEDSLRAIGLEPIEAIYASFISDHQIDTADLSSFQGGTIESFVSQYARYPYDEFDNTYVSLWEELDFPSKMAQYTNDHPEAFGNSQ